MDFLSVFDQIDCLILFTNLLSKLILNQIVIFCWSFMDFMDFMDFSVRCLAVMASRCVQSSASLLMIVSVPNVIHKLSLEAFNNVQ